MLTQEETDKQTAERMAQQYSVWPYKIVVCSQEEFNAIWNAAPAGVRVMPQLGDGRIAMRFTASDAEWWIFPCMSVASPYEALRAAQSLPGAGEQA